ncbi:unnamed protein product [Dibothriocephalus latus]|uniref:EGF-like domain-containing protein n=1 Tax=Dibothriocephalus latus TaxID=60516 RepID=A0A3P7LU61_DIBLA|nr:unnamed protein product [Dibothriocephalus latus]
MGTVDSSVIVFFLLIFASSGEGNSDVERIQLDIDILDFMLPKRAIEINYYYSAFTPYSDMMDVVLRASEFGFSSSLKRAGTLADSIIFRKVPNRNNENVTHTLTFQIDEMVRVLLQTAKAVTRRNPPRNAIPRLALFGLYRASIHPYRFIGGHISWKTLRITRFVYSTLKKWDAKMRKAAVFQPIFHALQHSTQSIKPPPLGLLVMHGWTLLFWVTVSEQANFFKRDEEKSRSIEEKAPTNLDELSATFIYHVCKIMRADRDLAPSDIPTGFCPNPCATLPCLRVRNAVGEECFHTGQGLFINDFRCTCLPGFQWIPAPGSSELGMKTPLTDEAGRCEPIDVCSTYCNLLGTRRCDVIPYTGNAICLCKVSIVAPHFALASPN